VPAVVRTPPAPTVTVAERARGDLTLRASPALPIRLDGREVAAGSPITLSRDAGVFELGADDTPIHVTVRYRVTEGGLVAQVDSTPWSVVTRLGNEARGRTPRTLELVPGLNVVELNGPGFEGPVRLTLRYAAR